MLQIDDLEAIHRFMMTTPAKTEAATTLKDEWVDWWNGLNWWERNTDALTYAQARNRRNAFLRANATTPEEQANVERVIMTGLTTEELEGGVRETDSKGNYSESGSSTLSLVAGAVAAGALLALWVMRR